MIDGEEKMSALLSISSGVWSMDDTPSEQDSQVRVNIKGPISLLWIESERVSLCLGWQCSNILGMVPIWRMSEERKQAMHARS